MRWLLWNSQEGVGVLDVYFASGWGIWLCSGKDMGVRMGLKNMCIGFVLIYVELNKW